MLWPIAFGLLPFGVAAIIWARGSADAARWHAGADHYGARTLGLVHTAQAAGIEAETADLKRNGRFNDDGETVH